MDNKDLFQKVANGYDCAEVDNYITSLKAEYKKVFEYAKTIKAQNEKLMAICRTHSDENKALKASGASPVAGVQSSDPAVLASFDRIKKLSEEIIKENAVLRAKISK